MATRRQFIRGGAAAVASLLWTPAVIRRSNAQAVAPLRPNILAPPDFAKLRPHATFMAGVRPHRIGGVNLSTEELGTPSRPKFLIHNYGHSGAGITLSWGCAAVVRDDHVAPILNQLRGTATRASVIGCGVIGLTVATELRRRWPALPITVYAKTLDLKQTTSWVAGGQFEPSQIYHQYEDSPERKQILERYVSLSASRIREIQNSGRRLRFGVAQRKNYTLDDHDAAFDDFTPCDAVPPFRRGTLPFPHLNEVGREYSTYLMNPQLLLPTLVADLKSNGVLFRTRDFQNRAMVEMQGETIIVNCTGYGAGELFNDPAVVPRRGLLAVLANPAKLTYFFSGGCSNDAICYMFARQNDIVIGGTIEATDRTSVTSDDRTTVGKRLLDNIQDVFAGNPGVCVDPINGTIDPAGPHQPPEPPKVCPSV
jgi:glycine/D-amino acid oxidase-like deaminating enzyme